MTNKLKIVSRTEIDPESTTRERVSQVIAERRALAIESVERALVYFASVGAERIYFEEIPGVHQADAPFVLDWLEAEGFEVRRSRFGGRTAIVIQ